MMQPVTTTGVCTQDGFRLAHAMPVANCTRVGGGGHRHTSSLVVVGCARRIADALGNRTIPYLDALLAQDAVLSSGPRGRSRTRLHTSVIVYHDDPTDLATLRVLHDWAARNRAVHLILSDMGERGERIQRLTLCRNVLNAEALARLPRVRSTGAVAAAGDGGGGVHGGVLAQLDLDCRHGSPLGSPAALLDLAREMVDADSRAIDGGPLTASSPSAASAFDVVTTNNPGAYRDMWVLRSSTLGMDYDCFWDFRAMKKRGNCKRHRIYVHPRALPFELAAGFNGLALYSSSALRRGASCRYTNETRDESGRGVHVVSEHVPFQLCLRSHGARIGLMPSLSTSCHPWSTRSDARRTFMRDNGTVESVRGSGAEKRWFAALSRSERNVWLGKA